MSNAVRIDLTARIGARTLLRIPRRLVRVALDLDAVLAGAAPMLPPLPKGAHGYLVTSLPETLRDGVATGGLRTTVRQRYTRRYADLTMGFDAYLAQFSGKTRATLLRKVRRFADGEPDVRHYRSENEIMEFERLARPLSQKTYQEKLLGAGLGDNSAAMKVLAARDAVRAFLLFRDGVPVSYLYLPARGDTLVYAYLGYDPALAGLSPGTVLQLEAMRMLMAEGCFERLDFTEGDGQHKALFATGGVPCVDLLLLRPGLVNRLAVDVIQAFDALVARLKWIGRAPALRPLANALRR